MAQEVVLLFNIYFYGDPYYAVCFYTHILRTIVVLVCAKSALSLILLHSYYDYPLAISLFLSFSVGLIPSVVADVSFYSNSLVIALSCTPNSATHYYPCPIYIRMFVLDSVALFSTNSSNEITCSSCRALAAV